jgi:molecular chaperone DnaK
VVQGERALAKDNVTLGRFQLTGIPPASRGIPQIEVTFDIDANGITHVSAKDLATGNEQAITIKGGKGISDRDIHRMVNDAKGFEEEDRKKREEIELRNMADSAIYQAEKTLKDAGDRIDAADRAGIESAVGDLRKALDANDPDGMKKELERLTEAVYGVTQKMYAKAQAARQEGQAGPAGSGGTSDEKVVDADYEVKDDA